jgi:hypothetical protein
MNKLIFFTFASISFFNFITCSEQPCSVLEVLPQETIKHHVIPTISLKSLSNLSTTSKKIHAICNPNTLLKSQDLFDQQIIAQHFKSFHKTSRALMNFHEANPEVAQFIWNHQPKEKKTERFNAIKQIANETLNPQLTNAANLQDIKCTLKPNTLPENYQLFATEGKNLVDTYKEKKYIQSLITTEVIAALKQGKPTFDNLIFCACYQGDYHLVKYLLKNNNLAITEYTDQNKHTMLHQACYSLCTNSTSPAESYIKLIQLLIKKEIDVNAQNNYGETALHILSSRHANINSDVTAQAIDLLMEKGANQNIIDNQLCTPHHWTAITQNNVLQKTLENHGTINKWSYRCRIAKEIAKLLAGFAIPATLFYLSLMEEHSSKSHNQTAIN